jgi:tRNA(fMet)-specific endonuclease VapC
MQYLLDANAIIGLLNDTTSPIARRVRRHSPRDFGVSAAVIHELHYGAF